ncbi:MAG: ABC transporter ATP-binding protein [Planctomycetota bacterium]
MSDTNLITLSSVTKIHGEGRATQVRALDGVDLKVPKGDFAAIVGPSGSGKSTLLHILGCLDRPNSGSYLLDGENTAELSDRDLSLVRNRKIGFVFQVFHLLPDETAVENVMLPLTYRGVSPRDARERAMNALQSVGLSDRVGHRPGELSGGEQQRVAIARALVKEPAVLLADEPTGNLDSKNGAQILGLLGEANARGITLVVITHDAKVAAFARRRFTIVDGQIQPEGEPT